MLFRSVEREGTNRPGDKTSNKTGKDILQPTRKRKRTSHLRPISQKQFHWHSLLLRDKFCYLFKDQIPRLLEIAPEECRLLYPEITSEIQEKKTSLISYQEVRERRANKRKAIFGNELGCRTCCQVWNDLWAENDSAGWCPCQDWQENFYDVAHPEFHEACHSTPTRLTRKGQPIWSEEK